uniref:Tudor domain-containing protein 1 n=1 Tax=Hydra vulgaris TaxID=6087 RepID=T2M6M2_HYDVU
MQRSLTCKNCYQNYDFLKDNKPIGPHIPLMLPCGHTFCEGCLLKAAKKQSEIKCFECEEVHKLEVNGEIGVKHFLPDIYLLGLISYNRRLTIESSQSYLCGGPLSSFNGLGCIAQKINSSVFNENIESDKTMSESSNILCEECLTKNATCQCNICENCKFCDACFNKIHQGSKTLSKHQSISLSLESDIEISCSVHHGRKLEFYDQQLKQPVCALCAISEKCQGHHIAPIIEMFDNKDLHKAYQQVQETLFWLQHSKEKLKTSIPSEIDEVNKIFTDIHSKFNTAHSLLQKRQIEILEEVADTLLTDTTSTNKLIESISKKLSCLNATLKDYECVKKDQRIMSLKSSKLLKSLNDFVDIPCILQIDQDGYRIKSHLNEDFIYECVFLKTQKNEKFKLKKLNEVSTESLEKIMNPSVSSAENCFFSHNYTDIFDTSRSANDLVNVTFVEDPYNFTVQLNADKERLLVMMSALNKHCRSANSQTDLVYKVEKGQLFCAQFSVDNFWYRARVVTSHPPNKPELIPTWNNDLTIQVHYVDFGNKEWLPLNRLRQIKKEFFELPEMGMPCSLTDIAPPCQAQSWSTRSIKAFKSLVADKTLLMTTFECCSNKYIVDLQLHNTLAQTNIENDRPASIRDALVFIEVASYSPHSKLKIDVNQYIRKYKDAVCLTKKEMVSVCVTNIESPEYLFIQRLDSSILEIQDGLSKLYRDQNNSKIWTIEWPYKDMICAAKFSEDGNWYRALVKQVNNNDSVDVEYVDYGNCETVSITSIKKIPEMYLLLPKQALKVKLWNFEKKNQEDWSPETKKSFEKYLLNKQLVAVVQDVVDNTISVELFDTSTDKDISINALFFDKTNTDKKGILLENNTAQAIKSYKQPIFPAKHKFNAICVHIDPHCLFYLQPEGCNNVVIQFMEELNSAQFKFESCPSTTLLSVNQACVARFSEDNCIYRSKVLQIIDDSKVKVEYVDFGNSEIIDKSKVCLKSWYDEIPIQCLSIQLADVIPVNKVWSQEAIMFLSKKVSNKIVEVGLQEHGINNTLIPSATVKIQNENISYVLVAAGYAKSTTNLSSLNDKKNAQAQLVFSDAKKVSKIMEYKKPRFPNLGKRFDVIVTQVDSPNLVYIQRYPPSDDCPLFVDDSEDVSAADAYNQIQELHLMSEMINQENYFDNLSYIKTPHIGMPCIARYTEDGLYYRARIDNIDMDTMKAEIIFVDYGTSETLPIGSLKPITEELLQLPLQSTLVTICGIKKLSNKNTDEKWDINTTKQFYNIVANKRLIAQWVGHDQNARPKIHLYDRCYVEASEKGLTKDCLIGEMMCQSGFVRFELDEHETIFKKVF